MGKILESLLGGAGSIIGSGIGAITTGIENAKDRKWNEEQAALNREYQTSEREATQDYNTSEREAAQSYNTSEREAAQDWNLEMWNLENAYNDPSAQMERMVAAGINPNSVAQGMAGNGSTAGSVQGSSGQSVSGASSSPGSGSVASSNVRPGSMADILANSVNTMWQNLGLQKDLAGKQLDNELKDKELGIFDEKWNITKEEINSRIELAKADAKDKEAAKDLKVQQFEFLENMNPIQLQMANAMYLKTKSEVDYIDQKIENLKKEYNLTEEQIKESQARQANIEADTALKNAQTDLTESEKALIDVQKLIADKENVIKGLEASAAEQGISFTAPDFWNAYEYEKVTGKRFGDLTKPYRKEQRRTVWRNAAANVTSNVAGSLANSLFSWFSNPFGASGAWRRSFGGWNPPQRSLGEDSRVTNHHNPPTSGKGVSYSYSY